jgi:hypothetical protein
MISAFKGRLMELEILAKQITEKFDSASIELAFLEHIATGLMTQYGRQTGFSFEKHIELLKACIADRRDKLGLIDATATLAQASETIAYLESLDKAEQAVASAPQSSDNHQSSCKPPRSIVKAWWRRSQAIVHRVLADT